MADHVWIGGSIEVPLDSQQAAMAGRRGSIRLRRDAEIRILEVYCRVCCRGWKDAADGSCEAAENNDHLIGGPTGRRRPRTHTHDCVAYGCSGTGISPAVAAAAIRAPVRRERRRGPAATRCVSEADRVEPTPEIDSCGFRASND